ncbi:MAG: hypothetical protein JWR19_2609 [Pedosphaera sp.]|nr:hypothetical protein [Pedosphaera sp.]
MPNPNTKEVIYNTWAPPDSVWSLWVKPVLFSFMDGPPPPFQPSALSQDLSWLPPAEQNVALVLDLPREEGVTLGLEMARRGYRLVPLYNSVPKAAPRDSAATVEHGDHATVMVEVMPILYALWRGTETLAQLAPHAAAPPVFLLDSNRRVGRQPPEPETFDNRSVSFTTDFPSAIFLRTRGISRVILVQWFQNHAQPDLAHTLRRWQEGGITIELKRLEVTDPPTIYNVGSPSRFGAFWYRVCQLLGLTRNALGGYGGIIGQSSGG